MKLCQCNHLQESPPRDRKTHTAQLVHAMLFQLGVPPLNWDLTWTEVQLPSSRWWGPPSQFWMGVPHSADGGTPWDGVPPVQTWEGVPHPELGRGYPLSRPGKGYPTPSRTGKEYPTPSRTGKGIPPSRPGKGYPPSHQPDGGIPPPPPADVSRLKILPSLILRMRAVKMGQS